MPALLTSTSTLLHRSLVSSTSVVHDASSVTSWWRKTALSPSSSARAAPGSLATSAMTTRAPSATKARTMASPCPWAPPVTMATLSVSRPMFILLDFQLHDGVGREPDRRVAVLEVAADLLGQVVEVPGVAGGVEPPLDHRCGQERDHAAVDDEDLSGDPLGRR